ncbi:unnamed protein product [Effrenium voratum]|uniref:Uncharacterized protein n=1 Tax=Effrenium voratum TaxID=2562239 RepID=A0AA36JFR2_9DINO|nr:unnamed protein product [Effrenium voratum]
MNSMRILRKESAATFAGGRIWGRLARSAQRKCEDCILLRKSGSKRLQGLAKHLVTSKDSWELGSRPPRFDETKPTSFASLVDTSARIIANRPGQVWSKASWCTGISTTRKSCPMFMKVS